MKKKILALLTVFCMLFPFCAHAEQTDDFSWYLEKAGLLKEELHALISVDGFAEFYSLNEELGAYIDSWKEALNAAPASVSIHPLPDVELLAAMLPEIQAMPDVMLRRIERSMASLLVSVVNGNYGSVFLAAASTAVVSEGYLMPEGFSPCVIAYDYGDICLFVSFTQIGEGVVSGGAQFAGPQIIEMLREAFPEEAA